MFDREYFLKHIPQEKLDYASQPITLADNKLAVKQTEPLDIQVLGFSGSPLSASTKSLSPNPTSFNPFLSAPAPAPKAATGQGTSKSKDKSKGKGKKSSKSQVNEPACLPLLNIIESPENNPQFFPACSSSSNQLLHDASAPRFYYAAASSVGKMHLKNQRPNQDAIQYRRLPHGCLMVAGDGVGSAGYSHVGSHLLIEAAEYAYAQKVQALDHLQELDVPEFLKVMHTKWTELITCLDFAVHDCKTTCLLTLLHQDSVLFAQLGDGLLCYFAEGEFYELKHEYEETDTNAAVFNNLTYALGTKPHISKWSYKICALQGIEGIIACSDGVTNMLHPEELPRFVHELLQDVRSKTPPDVANELLTIFRTWNQRKFTDDMTLGVIYRYHSQI